MIALLGRPDTPTDGVDDYCNFLGQALARRGFSLTRVHVAWNREGWNCALRRLWRESADWRGEWVLLQYTALSWSGRGFPWGALVVAAILHSRGARCGVVFHEYAGYGGARLRERVRSACQAWVVRSLYRKSARCIFTVPLAAVAWLPKDDEKTAFIPIGANLPEGPDAPSELRGRERLASPEREKRIIVFGVTGFPAAPREVADIAEIARAAKTKIAHLRLVVLGRGASEVQGEIAKALDGSGVELEVRGVLPAEEISREFAAADVLLFVRGPITLQRGSAIAGIACELPIAGYGSADPVGPLAEAGIEWAPWHDPQALAQALVRVLTDPDRWMDLHERNLRVHEKYFSWDRIAERYLVVLANPCDGPVEH